MRDSIFYHSPHGFEWCKSWIIDNLGRTDRKCVNQNKIQPSLVFSYLGRIFWGLKRYEMRKTSCQWNVCCSVDVHTSSERKVARPFSVKKYSLFSILHSWKYNLFTSNSPFLSSFLWNTSLQRINKRDINKNSYFLFSCHLIIWNLFKKSLGLGSTSSVFIFWLRL